VSSHILGEDEIDDIAMLQSLRCKILPVHENQVAPAENAAIVVVHTVSDRFFGIEQ
jgi:hypothetical protein